MKQAKLITAIAALCGMTGMTFAVAQQPTVRAHRSSLSSRQNLSPLDKTFMKEAAQGNLAEMKYAPLVYKMAQKTESKQFAQRMMRDHGQAQQSLKFLAAMKGYRLPNDTEKSEKEVLHRLSREKKSNSTLPINMR